MAGNYRPRSTRGLNDYQYSNRTFSPTGSILVDKIFLLAGGTNFENSFLYSMAVLSVILIPVGLYYGKLTIFAGGCVWLFVVWNVLYEPFAVLF